MKINSTAIAIVVGALIIAGAIIFIGQNKQTTQTTDQDSPYDLSKIEEPSASDHIQGNPDARIVLIEYSDLECPFCKQFHQTLKQIRGDYSDDDFAWVFRHAPLDNIHKQARIEAEASECVAKLAGEEAFFEYVSLVYENTNSNDTLDLNLLPVLAERVGANQAEFNQCLESGETSETVQADLDNAISASNSTPKRVGTPFVLVIIDGEERIWLPGAIPYENLKPAFDQVLTEEKQN